MSCSAEITQKLIKILPITPFYLKLETSDKRHSSGYQIKELNFKYQIEFTNNRI